MFNLSNLKPNRGAKKEKKRLGRGDTTAGRGTKGQKARSGGAKPPWFEGGQMPLYRRIPKRGFTNIFRVEYQEVNLDRLEEKFDSGSVITKETLYERGLIKKKDKPVKILGRGEVTKAFTVEVDAISKSAREKIEKAGGTVKVKGVK